jgi:hypothetical protein
VPTLDDKVVVESCPRPQPEDDRIPAGQCQNQQLPPFKRPWKRRRGADRGSGGADHQRRTQTCDRAVTAIAQRHAREQQRQSDDGAPKPEIERHETAAAHDREFSHVVFST